MSTKVLSGGTITSPKGFLAGATYAGVKKPGPDILDLAILHSEVPTVAAGLFTQNRVKAAPVIVCQERIKSQRAQAIVANSGCANACTGEQGFKDAQEMASLTAKKLGLPVEDVLVASTGVIGVNLPMERLREGIERISLSSDGGHALARGIMTTDTVPKETAVVLEVEGRQATIGGVTKGAGMIHPNMATMLCFLATDAAVQPDFLQEALKGAVADSFNMITIDGDTSTNDTVLILANGLTGNKEIKGGAPAEAFQHALEQVCLHLAKSIIRDAEGATRLIEVTVEGALSLADARLAARTVAGSIMVKAAVHGCDPNWGRIIAALGFSGAEMNPDKVDLYVSNLCLMRQGTPVPFDREEAEKAMAADEVPIRVGLNLGHAKATSWGCDLSEEYVTLNSAYTT